MTRRYVIQQVGVLDGTLAPPLQADGRQVNAKKRVIVATKQLTADQIADDIVLGRIPANAIVTEIKMLSSASLGSATIAIGIAGATGKYRAAGTFTTVDVPTIVGPPASTVAAGPLTAGETLIATVAAAALADTTKLVFIIEYVTNN